MNFLTNLHKDRPVSNITVQTVCQCIPSDFLGITRVCPQACLYLAAGRCVFQKQFEVVYREFGWCIWLWVWLAGLVSCLEGKLCLLKVLLF